MRSGQKVLVTAAAGGTGQFAVQLAKGAGNFVIATCGSESKAALLRRVPRPNLNLRRNFATQTICLHSSLMHARA